MTIHDQLCEAFRVLGYTAVPGKSAKYTVFEKGDIFYYVGRAGALRAGKTLAGSLSLPAKTKKGLIEKARAKQNPFSADELVALGRMIQQTWNYLADDASHIEGPITLAVKVELVIDADRLRTIGAKTADEKAIVDRFYKLDYPAMQKIAEPFLRGAG